MKVVHNHLCSLCCSTPDAYGSSLVPAVSGRGGRCGFDTRAVTSSLCFPSPLPSFPWALHGGGGGGGGVGNKTEDQCRWLGVQTEQKIEWDLGLDGCRVAGMG